MISCRVCEALMEKEGKNAKELTVKEGEVFEVSGFLI